MPTATLTGSSNGYARRILILTLATLLMFTTLAIVPGGAIAADSDEPATEQSEEPVATTEDPPAGETTTTTSVPSEEEPAVVVDESTTTTSTPPPEDTTAAEEEPIVEETTTTTSMVVEEPTTTTTTTTTVPPVEETTTTTLPVVETLAAAPLATAVFSPSPVGNKLKKHEVWDPALATQNWVPGHPKGYTEGETAAFRVTIEADANDELMFDVCLDFHNSGAYTFTAVESWNTSYNDMTTPPSAGDLGVEYNGFNGAGLNIESATYLGDGGGLCDANYLAWHVEFKMHSDVGTKGIGYVVYGGHLAAPDEQAPLTELAPTPVTVLDGEGAAAASGTFQARVETQGGGDKTVNFSGSDIIPIADGYIIVDKVTDPTGDPQLFDFNLHNVAGTGTAIDQNFQLADTTTPFNSGPLAPGTYSVAELAVPTDWAFDDVTCVNQDGQVDANPLLLGLDPGETITCTFTNSKTPTLILGKIVLNDDGGTADPADWTLVAAGDGGFTDTASIVVTPGVAGHTPSHDVKAGVTYALSETNGPSGYTPSDPWVCTINGTNVSQTPNTITLAPGDAGRCVITNDDVAPTLILGKIVLNDDGGTADPADWTLVAAGDGGFTDTASIVVTPGVAGHTPSHDVKAGVTYALSETNGPSGYTPSDPWVCTINGTNVSQTPNTITLAPGDAGRCVITNDDVAPTLKLVKTVTNHDGGLKVAADWTLSATAGGNRDFSYAGDADVFKTVYSNAGYVLTETTVDGYTNGAWSCVGGSLVENPAGVFTVTLAAGETGVVCTIVNDDDAPTLKLVKTVTNHDGGLKVAADWTLSATAGGNRDFSYAGDADVFKTVYSNAGYVLTETTVDGYTNGAWSCVGGSLVENPAGVFTVTLAAGETGVVCTIVNDDDAPTLKLVKTVTNHDGGLKVAADWTLSATAGGNRDFSYAGDADVFKTVYSNAGYVLTETTVDGYTNGAWSCVGGSLVENPAGVFTVTLAAGETGVVCTIVNDDDAPTLKLVKTVTNHDGGLKVAADWTLSATAGGNRDFSYAGDADVFKTVYSNAGYVLTETTVDGYTNGAWSCVGGSLVENPAGVFTVTLAAGETGVVCTIVNDDDAPTLKLVKTVTNHDGGLKVAADWTLSATAGGNRDFSYAGDADVFKTVYSNAGYVLTETTVDGYTNGAWSCVGGSLVENPAGVFTVTLAAGETGVVCTIVNDDDAPTLKLVKTVTNHDGGLKVAADWTLSATAGGNRDFSYAGDADVFKTVYSNAGYVLTETTVDGYTNGAWSCVGGSLVENPAGVFTVTLAAGETGVVCTIVNDDDAPTLKLVKTVTNHDGGLKVAADWTLSATAGGNRDFSYAGDADVFKTVYSNAGYVLTETTVDGYTNGAWSCVGGSLVENPAGVFTVTLAAGETGVVCTIVNDDDAPTLKLVKTVTNHDGGLKVAADWTLSATAGGNRDFSYAGDADVFKTVYSNAGYVLTETTVDGYTNGAWSCVGGSLVENPAGVFTVTLAAGETGVVCTIVNDDDAPTLKLVKTVTNHDGGLKVAADWTLSATAGGNRDFSYAGDADVFKTVYSNAGYVLTETTVDGYTNGAWSCVGGSLVENPAGVFTVTLAAGETGVVCTIVNDDDAPTLKLVKTVTNHDGGLKVAADWTLSATAGGNRDFSYAGDADVFKTVYSNAGYVLTETTVDGYTNGAWSCVGGSLVENPAGVFTVTLAAGETGVVCTIVNDDDAPTLKLVKTVTNHDGGLKVAADWTLSATAGGNRDFSYAGDADVFKTVYSNAGYVLTETTVDGYTNGAWSCVGGSLVENPAGVFTVTLAAGETGVVCTIVNDDDAPTLKLVKTVTNHDGGLKVAADWTLSATAGGNRDFSYAGDADVFKTVYSNAGYVLTETTVDGYTNGAWSCVGGSLVENPAGVFTVTLAAGETGVVCTIVNDDDAPTLKLVKTVTNHDGGLKVAADWTLSATAGGNRDFSYAGDADVFKTVYSNAGYVLTETTVDGYTNGAWSCVGGSLVENPAGVFTVTLAAGETGVVCTIVNDDDAPTLKLVKTVTNHDGGLKVAADWTLSATAGGNRDFSYAGDADVFKTVYSNAGYVLTETTVDGYTNGAWSCVGGSLVENPAGVFTVTLAAGETGVVCTIVNDDDAPTLKLVKTVTNHDGGLKVAADWTLSATAGGNRDFSYAGDADVFKTVYSNAGYVLTETTVDGYTNGAWSCVGGSLVENPAGVFTVTLAAGETGVVCTIVNDDDAPTLMLIKNVTNNHGGTAVAADWNLIATSTSGDGDFDLPADKDTSLDNLYGTTGYQDVYANNEYTLSEKGSTGHTDDYTQDGPWHCVTTSADGVVGPKAFGNTITLAEGESAACGVTNDDDSAELTLVKHVINDNGGTEVAADWTLSATSTSGFGDIVGATPDQNTTTDKLTGDTGPREVHANNEYTLSETGSTDYAQVGMWSCVIDGANPVLSNTITLAHGATATCTATNDDKPVSLMLVKDVVNNNGGNGVASDWTLSAGTNSVAGSATPVEATDQVGTYALSESTVQGYENTSLTCDNDPGVQVTSVTIGFGETITCTFVNDDLTVGIGIEKSTNGEDADLPTGPFIPVGDAVTWEYVITNPGLITLSNVVVTDDRGVTPTYVSGDVNTNDLLEPGEKWIYVATGVSVAGQYANIGTVTAVVGTPPPLAGAPTVTASSIVPAGVGDTITADDPSHYFGSAPVIDITKDVEPAVIPVNTPGDISTEVTWTIKVTNTGNVALHDVVVTDALVPVCDLAIGDLAVGGSHTYTCNSTHTPDNLAWTFTNVAVTTGIGPAGTTVTAEDDAKIDPIYVSGTAQGGDTVFLDKDKDGVQDADEPGINGAKVILKDADGNIIATQITAKGAWDGFYKFLELDAGTYTFELDLSSVSGDLTTPGSFTVTLVDGQDYLDADFGVAEVLPVTGMNSQELALIALGLLLLGALAVLSTRKRREET